MKKRRIIRVNRKLVILSFIALLLSMITPVSYAFFTATVNGNNNASDSVVQAGTMRLRFVDGEVIGTTSNWIPGSSVIKTFTVENVGSLPANYSVFLEDIVNDFADKSELVYEILGTTNGNNSAYSTSSAVQAPSSTSKIIDNILIASGEKHSYSITLRFNNLNKEQDYNQNKSFEGKLQVYDVHNEPQIGNSSISKLVSLKTQGATDLEYDGVDNLGELGTSDNNLRYVGATPANYVYFNCSTTNPSNMNSSTCEKWRIIGLFNNIEKGDNTTESLIKIVRDESLGNYSWDTSSSSSNSGWGINQWGESGNFEGADLMRELNTDYIGTITVGNDGKWYNGINNKKMANMPTNTINSTYLNMVETVKWGLGDSGYNTEWNNRSPHVAYTNERNAATGNIDVGNNQIARTRFWTGKIALIYPSDLGFATSGGNSLSRNNCLSISINMLHNSQYNDCTDNNWLSTTNSQWNLSYYGGDVTSPYYAYYSSKYADNSDTAVYEEMDVRPTLYLKSSVSIDSGEGTSVNPYKLSM